MKPRFITVHTKKEFKIAVINPDNGELVPITYWEKEMNPQRASVVCISTDDHKWLAIAKCNVDGGKGHTFNYANNIASRTTLKGCEGATFRLPTRKECSDIYDARFYGLDDAVSLIGGNPLTSWFWTCESDTDPKYNAAFAFIFYGGYGELKGHDKSNSHTFRPVATFEV